MHVLHFSDHKMTIWGSATIFTQTVLLRLKWPTLKFTNAFFWKVNRKSASSYIFFFNSAFYFNIFFWAKLPFEPRTFMAFQWKTQKGLLVNPAIILLEHECQYSWKSTKCFLRGGSWGLGGRLDDGGASTWAATLVICCAKWFRARG